jgi:hypothetical protein
MIHTYSSLDVRVREFYQPTATVTHVVAEHQGSRLEVVVAKLDDQAGRALSVAVLSFGKCARVGYGYEAHYIAEKLGLAEPDAFAVKILCDLALGKLDEFEVSWMVVR